MVTSCVDEKRFGEVEATRDRCENYAMLSRLFRIEIDEPLLHSLIDSPAPDRTGNADFDEGYLLVREHLDGIDDVPAGKSALAIDYCLAFVGYGTDPDRTGEGPHAAYPYESIYVSGASSLASASSAPVSVEYRCAGFSPTKERIVADDHIACELEFLQFLVAGELSAEEKGDARAAAALREQQLAFIEGHPLKWMRDFESAIETFAETGFYRGLARMTRGWLEEDARYLRGVAGDERGDV